MYQALYRRYRPQRFADVVGQDMAVRVLRNAVRRNRVAHAYLLAGPRGTGKTSLAKIMARAVNCLQPQDGEPCGECAVCRGSGLHTVEIDAASNRGIDEIRELREKSRYAPPEGRCKVYIIDEVHMLTTEAFNALLKTLEEPTGELLFLLATTEPHRLPLTVLSRCQRLNLRQHTKENIAAELRTVAQQAQITVDEEACGLIADRADGSLRDALGLLELCVSHGSGEVDADTVLDATGTVGEAALRRWLDCVQRRDAAGALTWVSEMEASGADLRQIVQDLVRLLRQQLERAYVDGSGDPTVVFGVLSRLAQLDIELRRGLDPRLGLELATVELSDQGSAAETRQRPASAEQSVRRSGSGAANRRPAPRQSAAEEDDAALGRMRTLLQKKDARAYALLEKAQLVDAGDVWELRFRYAPHLALAEVGQTREAIMEAGARLEPAKPLRFAMMDQRGD